MQHSTKNFMEPPHFIKAAPRPEYSRPFDSSIMASSKCPEGLSTGILPVSAMTSMRKANSIKICAGSKKFARGVTQCFWTIYGIVEPAIKETVKEHNHEHRFSQKAYHPGAAGPHRPVRVAGIYRRQGGEEPAQGQDKPATQHVPHEGEKEGIVGQYRNQEGNKNRSNEDHEGCEAKNPGTLV